MEKANNYSVLLKTLHKKNHFNLSDEIRIAHVGHDVEQALYNLGIVVKQIDFDEWVSPEVEYDRTMDRKISNALDLLRFNRMMKKMNDNKMRAIKRKNNEILFKNEENATAEKSIEEMTAVEKQKAIQFHSQKLYELLKA